MNFANYFSLIPHDALQNVVRLCSTHPNRDDWPCFLESDTILMMHDALPEIDTLLNFDAIRDDKNSLSYLVDDVTIDINELASNISVLSASQNLAALTKFLRTMPRIMVGVSGNVSNEVCDAIISHCDGMKALIVEANCEVPEFERIIVTRGHQLLELQLCLMPGAISIVSDHCTQLRSLCIWRPHGWEPNLPSLLSHVGGELRKLNFTGDVRRQEFEAIRAFCPRLESVSIQTIEDSDFVNNYIDLLVSYGAQLQNARITSCSVAQADLILENCPNVSVDAFQFLDQSSVRALGRLVARASFDLVDIPELARFGLLRDNLSTCSSLHTLVLGDVDDDTPLAEWLGNEVLHLPNLRHFTSHSSFGMSGSDLELLGRCTTGLRYVDILLKRRDNQMLNGLAAFVHLNPGLTHVRLTIIGVTPQNFTEYVRRRQLAYISDNPLLSISAVNGSTSDIIATDEAEVDGSDTNEDSEIQDDEPMVGNQGSGEEYLDFIMDGRTENETANDEANTASDTSDRLLPVFPKCDVQLVLGRVMKTVASCIKLHELIIAAYLVDGNPDDCSLPYDPLWRLEPSIRDVIPVSFRHRRVQLNILGRDYYSNPSHLES